MSGVGRSSIDVLGHARQIGSLKAAIELRLKFFFNGSG
jgi:hypothetical protein